MNTAETAEIMTTSAPVRQVLYSLARPHRHRGVSSKNEDYGFQVPVAYPENPMAHGNICRTEYCRCGAFRNVNINGRHREVGVWQAMEV